MKWGYSATGHHRHVVPCQKPRVREANDHTLKPWQSQAKTNRLTLLFDYSKHLLQEQKANTSDTFEFYTLQTWPFGFGVIFVYFWDKVSLCSPGWPQIHYVAQDSFFSLLSAGNGGLYHPTPVNILLLFFERGFLCVPSLSQNSHYRSCWSQTHRDPPATASLSMGIKGVCHHHLAE